MEIKNWRNSEIYVPTIEQMDKSLLKKRSNISCADEICSLDVNLDDESFTNEYTVENSENIFSNNEEVFENLSSKGPESSCSSEKSTSPSHEKEYENILLNKDFLSFIEHQSNPQNKVYVNSLTTKEINAFMCLNDQSIESPPTSPCNSHDNLIDNIVNAKAYALVTNWLKNNSFDLETSSINIDTEKQELAVVDKKVLYKKDIKFVPGSARRVFSDIINATSSINTNNRKNEIIRDIKDIKSTTSANKYNGYISDNDEIFGEGNNTLIKNSNSKKVSNSEGRENKMKQQTYENLDQNFAEISDILNEIKATTEEILHEKVDLKERLDERSPSEFPELATEKIAKPKNKIKMTKNDEDLLKQISNLLSGITNQVSSTNGFSNNVLDNKSFSLSLEVSDVESLDGSSTLSLNNCDGSLITLPAVEDGLSSDGESIMNLNNFMNIKNNQFIKNQDNFNTKDVKSKDYDIQHNNTNTIINQYIETNKINNFNVGNNNYNTHLNSEDNNKSKDIEKSSSNDNYIYGSHNLNINNENDKSFIYKENDAERMDNCNLFFNSSKNKKDLLEKR